MSSAGISFGGLASGLDTKAIITALVAVERRPIDQLETKKTSLNKQKSLFGDLKGLLEKLSTAAKALKTKSDFLAMKAASDKEEIVGATASNSAAAGTYSVEVLELAKARVLASTGSATATQNFGTSASMLIEIDGNTHPIAIANPVTLDSIAAAINDQDIGVRAEVVDTQNPANGGANRYQLVVRAEEPGVANSFTLTYDDGTTAFQNLIADINGNQITAASDAQIRLNGGVTVYRPTNTISDAIPGVTLDLKSKTAANEPVTITVATDAEATSKDVQAFVDAYNKVVDFFTEQGALDSEGKAKNPLFGDSMLRSIRSNLRGVVGSLVGTTGNQSFQMLSQIGITTDTAGKLTFNTSKFEEALGDDEGAVAAIFSDATNGIAGRLITQLTTYTDSVDGLIKARSDGFDRQVKQTQSRIDQSEGRLERYRQSLEQKYSNLESLLSRLQSQGSSLGSLSR
ncbi:MAG: flagellar filament capping protein FliD [Planctomycetes bacterium]|nr:flagellar filament capping protein FliD [Planctomycetota bacterium]